MKKFLILLPAIFLFAGLSAQTSTDDGKVEVIYPTQFKVTPPLSELIAKQASEEIKPISERKEVKDKEKRMKCPYSVEAQNGFSSDDAVQKFMGNKALQPTVANWAGLPGDGYPPDPTGAAGPNHYVQAVNLSYKIYTKSGGNVTNGGPFNLGDLLFGVDNGDPIVLYDKYAGRWFISQFGTYANNKIYIAVSQTSDPTGSYYTWQYTSAQFPDYLKFSIWQDGYYMTSNQSTQKVIAFERTQMIAGSSSARAISKTFSPPNDGGFFCPLPADADGQLPPSGTPCPIFTYEDNGWGSGYVDRINIYNMTVNWAATPTATITLAQQLPTAAFDGSYNSSWLDIPQPGTSQKLDGIGGVFTFRAQYRRWTGYNTVVLCHGVKVSSTQRSIRWYELRQNQTTGSWSIYQQSTYAPDALYRWCGSIAMDDNGSIGMAYAVSASTTVYPSIRYTGRTAVDGLNTMSYTEQVAIAGSASQTGVERFGDYSHTSLDPSDGTLFWHTGEYISTGGNPATRIFSFRIPYYVGIGENSTETSFNTYIDGNAIKVAATGLTATQPLSVDLFDINGRLLVNQMLKATDGKLFAEFSTYGLSAGTYLVRIGEPNTAFQRVNKVIVP